jgi:hypothetical protein
LAEGFESNIVGGSHADGPQRHVCKNFIIEGYWRTGAGIQHSYIISEFYPYTLTYENIFNLLAEYFHPDSHRNLVKKFSAVISLKVVSKRKLRWVENNAIR